MATKKRLFLIFEIENFANTQLWKVTKFGGNRPKTEKVINRQTKFTWKTPPPSANRVKVPFMMYADFESILMPIQGPNPDPGKANIAKVNQYIPSGWCVYSKFAYGDVKDPLTIYRG